MIPEQLSLQTKIWRNSLWLTIPLALVLTIWLASGMQRYAQLGSAVGPQFNVTLTEVLEYEARRMLIGWKDKSLRALPDDAYAIKSIQLKVAKGDLKALNSNLPQSGKQYVKGRLQDRKNEYKIKLRYRGNSPVHWRGDKKSIRIRMVNDKLYNGLDTFELMVPSDEFIIGPYLGGRLAEKLNLLAPKIQLVWLNINGESKGLYTLIETMDEQTLVNNNQMPGDMYAGEVAKRDAFITADNQLFNNAGLWQKLAYNSDYPQGSKAPLEVLVNWLKQPDVDYNKLQQLVDYPSFARFYLYHRFMRSANVDGFHNWRLYFDHSRGRFFPLVWDPEGWPKDRLQPSLGKVFDVLLKDAAFDQALNQQYHELDLPKVLEQFIDETQLLVEKLKPWVDADPLSSIDITYYDSEAFVKAAQLKLNLMAGAFEYTREKPDPIEPLTAQVWQGVKEFDGINHIRVPVKIMPGSRILLGPGALLVFHQKLEMLGNEQAFVEVTSKSDEAFGAFAIKGRAADGSVLQYCRFSNGSRYKNSVINYTAMLSLHEVEKVTIDHCRFSDNQKSDDMVHGVYADMTISNSIFTQAVADGLDLELSSALISKSYFSRNGREGVDLMHSDVVLRDVQLIDNLDTALSIGQKSRVRLESSIIKGSKNAILVKDSSIARVINSNLFANERIAELKQSNDNYQDGGILYVYRSKLFDNKRYFEVEKNSNMAIYDSYLAPSFTSTKKRIVIDELTDSFEANRNKGALLLHKHDLKAFKLLDERIIPLPSLARRGREYDSP